MRQKGMFMDKKLVNEFIEVVYDCGYEKAKSDMLNELKFINGYTEGENDLLTRVKYTVKTLQRKEAMKLKEEAIQ